MKRILLYWGLMFYTCACIGQEKTGFVFEGSISDIKDGRMLIVYTGSGYERDTIASGEIRDHKFRITGFCDSIMEVALIPEGRVSGGIPFFLENSENKFTMVIDGYDARVKHPLRGGETQNIANEFFQNSVKFSRKLSELRYKTEEYFARGDTVNGIKTHKEYVRTEKRHRQIDDSLLYRYRDTYAAAYVVRMRGQGNGEILRKESKILGPNAWNTSVGRQIKHTLEQYEKLKVGNIAPDFAAVTYNGQDTVTLHSVVGKVKLLDFWASWCSPCRQENLRLKELYNRYHDKGFEIISFSIDREVAAWKEAVEHDQMPWLQLGDPTGKISIESLYIVQAIPQTYLLDADNKIIACNVRGGELEKLLQQLLEK